eukprot:scaffold4243_cov25-Prasinocladus_malaysianus.AAC.1
MTRAQGRRSADVELCRGWRRANTVTDKHRNVSRHEIGKRSSRTYRIKVRTVLVCPFTGPPQNCTRML